MSIFPNDREMYEHESAHNEILRKENAELQLEVIELKDQLQAKTEEVERLRSLLVPFNRHAHELRVPHKGVKFFKDCDYNHNVYEHSSHSLLWGDFDEIRKYFEEKSQKEEAE